MSLSIGLVGMPNAGKSTTFNVLVQRTAAFTAGFPFSTTEPNRALVKIPDPRLERIGALVSQPRRVAVTVEFVDIAGLVEGASAGEGLGNQFLHHIRECDALLHVVNCFAPVTHPRTDTVMDPVSLWETVRQEMMLSDLERLERKRAALEREVKGDPARKPILDVAHALHAELETGVAIGDGMAQAAPAFPELEREMRFITAKPELILANMGEDRVNDPASYGAFTDRGCRVVPLCSRLEEEMLELTAEERSLFREEYGLSASGLDRVIHACFDMLSLIRFYTLGDNEVRAWEILRGSSAPAGAGLIHTDFERGFIAADVVDYATFVKLGSERAVRQEGLMRTEGKGYAIQDGDIIRFRFNV